MGDYYYVPRRPLRLRKRSTGTSKAALKAYVSPYKKTTTRRYVPGRNRTSGFYGRFGVANGGELKFKDSNYVSGAVPVGGIIVAPSINLIAQGTGEQQRVGRKCTIESIHMRFNLNVDNFQGAIPQGGDNIRTIVYLDSQANGAAATVTDILATAGLNSFRNLANSLRFKILMDKTHSINYAGIGSNAVNNANQHAVTRYYTWNKKCKIPLEFSGSTGVISEIRSNNVGVLLISDVGVGFEIANFRVRFSDKSSG